MPALKLSELLNPSFLNGDGTISVISDEDLLPLLWQSDQPFPEDVAHGPDKLLVLDVKATPDTLSASEMREVLPSRSEQRHRLTLRWTSSGRMKI